MDGGFFLLVIQQKYCFSVTNWYIAGSCNFLSRVPRPRQSIKNAEKNFRKNWDFWYIKWGLQWQVAIKLIDQKRWVYLSWQFRVPQHLRSELLLRYNTCFLYPLDHRPNPLRTIWKDIGLWIQFRSVDDNWKFTGTLIRLVSLQLNFDGGKLC